MVFIAQRRILPKPTRKANKLKQKRPILRTLVAVHTAILDDLKIMPAAAMAAAAAKDGCKRLTDRELSSLALKMSKVVIRMAGAVLLELFPRDFV